MQQTLSLLLLASLLAGSQTLNAVDTNRESNVEIPNVRLSPRPLSVAEVGAPTLDLGGKWLHKTNAETNFADKSAAGVAGWTEIEIPRPLPRGGRFGYQRMFRVPDDWAGKRIKFRCDSAEGLAEVWVNGQTVGKHDGSWAQFEMDITEAVRMGQENILSIQVSPSPLGYLTKDAQGGIRRKVYLMALPRVCLARLQVETKFDEQFRDATLALKLDVANESDMAENASLSWRLQDAGGKDVTLGQTEKALPRLNAKEISVAELTRLPLPEGDFSFFWGWSSGILRDFNSSASKTACSGDLPSCGLSRSAGILPACF